MAKEQPKGRKLRSVDLLARTFLTTTTHKRIIMKTVERNDGTISRLSNEEAERTVKSGKGKYVPKSKWKSEVRDKK